MYGDTQILGDMGTPFLCVCDIVSLVQGSQIDQTLRGKANLQSLKSIFRGKD